MKSRIAAIASALVTVLASATSPALAGVPQYRVVELGAFAGAGASINASGSVAGFTLSPGGTTEAFVYDGTSVLGLGVPGENSSESHAINDPGVVVGTSYSAGVARAIIRSGNVTRYLFDDGAGKARDINTAGEVTGEHAGHAFLFDGVQRRDLGTLGGAYSSGHAVNDSGHVAGVSETADGLLRAFAFDGVTMRDLGTLGGFSWAWDINASGHITGVSEDEAGASRAFIHLGDEMVDIGTLGGQSSFGFGINDGGYVTGYSYNESDTGATPRAFIYDGLAMHDLNDLMDASGDGWFLAEGRAINNAGQITGWGYKDNVQRAFLLTPVPEPEAWMLLLAGLGLTGWHARHRRMSVGATRSARHCGK